MALSGTPFVGLADTKRTFFPCGGSPRCNGRVARSKMGKALLEGLASHAVSAFVEVPPIAGVQHHKQERRQDALLVTRGHCVMAVKSQRRWSRQISGGIRPLDVRDLCGTTFALRFMRRA